MNKYLLSIYFLLGPWDSVTSEKITVPTLKEGLYASEKENRIT